MLHCSFFSPEKLALLSFLDEGKLCPGRIVIKPLLTFDNFFHHHDISLRLLLE